MTGVEALAELLDRIGASRDGVVFVSEQELREWSVTAVTTLRSAGLLAPASPVSTVVCPGCERQCNMPVHVLPAAEAFVVCDKRSDINRVPIEAENLTRWRASGEAVAALLARLLRLRRRSGLPVQRRRWEVGTFKGRQGSSHLVLTADGELKLGLAGHTVALADVLSVTGRSLASDEAWLVDHVDHPASGGGDRESAGQRRARLLRRLEELKGEGRRDFFRTVAREEGIAPQRLRQIVNKGKP